MSVRDLLFEIGTEEIPARFMPKTINDAASYTAEELSGSHIEYGNIKVFATPRRITIFVSGLSESQQDSVETAKGPMKSQAFDSEGKPTKAAEGFAKSRGVGVEDLKFQTIGNAEYIIAEKREAGKPTYEVLPAILEKIMKKL